MENLKEYIQSITDLSEASWTILKDCFTELSVNKGTYLLKENEVCNAVYFISSGYCKSFYNKEGKEINTAFYFERDFFTNIVSLKSGEKSKYSIKACEYSEVIKFDKLSLLDAYKKSREIETFGRTILEIIIKRQEEHIDTFKLLTPAQRYDNLLLKQPGILQRVSLTQISSYLGISRETLSRIRGK
ncbi:MAG: Crp/Fnr family transcriptional regulator [Melioribacteraceae bacterium]